MPIEKLRPTFTFTQERLMELGTVVPEAYADGKVNWDTLRSALSEYLEGEDENAEHFGLFWPGKRQARRIASIPSRGALVPSGGGVDDETSRNVFIEGDNLETLKLLRKSYAGRVQMVFVDPPYNRDKDDLVYVDSFTDPLEAYLIQTRQKTVDGTMLTSNPETRGRFHSAWLSMMYPRLLLAKQLLRPEGFIFVSIDDSEVHSLRHLMNEVFGEENFIAQFVWNTEGHTDNQYDAKVNHEYVIVYAKDGEAASLGFVIDPNTRDGSNLWKGYAENSITKNGPANPPSEVVLPVGFPCTVDSLNLPATQLDPKFLVDAERHRYITRDMTRKYDVTYPIRKDSMLAKKGVLTKECRVFSGWANVDKLRAFIKRGCQPITDEDGGSTRFYLSEGGVVYYRKDRSKARNILTVLRNMGTTEQMRSELERVGIVFPYPKPKQLLNYLIQIGAEEGGIVVDFFAGSCTTAHAVMELNCEKKTQRQFIMVQLPEPTAEGSPAKIAGFATISEIGRKRIAKFSKELKSTAKKTASPDLGFRCFTYRASNFKGWKDYNGQSAEEVQALFDNYESPLVDGWKKKDLFTEVLLMQGFPLDSAETNVKGITNNKVVLVESPFCEFKLYVCLDETIDAKTIGELELKLDDVFVCLDTAVTDKLKIQLADKVTLKII